MREFSWLSGANQLSAVISMLTVVVLTRTVGLHTAGQVFFAQAVAGVLMLFLDVRFEDAIQRYVPQYHKLGANMSVLYWRLVRWDLLFGLAVGTLAAVAWVLDLIPKTSIANPDFIVLAILSSALATTVGSLNAAFAVVDKLELLAKMTVVLATLNAGLMIAGTLLSGGRGFLMGAILASGVQVFALFLVARRAIRPVGRNTACPETPGLAHFLVKSSLASSAAIGSEQGVIAVAGFFGSTSHVALLRVAIAPYKLVMSVFSPIAVQAFPRLVRMSVDNDWEAMRALTSRATRTVLIVGLPASVAAILLMNPVLDVVFGQPYAEAAVAAGVFFLAAVLRSSIAWAKVLPLALGRPGLRLIVVSVESALMLVFASLIAHETKSPANGAGLIAAANCLLAIGVMTFWLRIRRSNLLGSGVGVASHV